MIREIKRNAPIAQLIKDFANKRSGKVADSRIEIKRRFEYLDWKDQKKIMQVFLDSGKGDRDWAYSKLIGYWDKSFEQRIKTLWEELHEVRCSWVIVRHFPIKYLVDHIDAFTGDRDYYFLCLRLAGNKEFVIDKSKLSKTDYLSVIYHTGRNIEVNEAEQILYEIVHDTCLDCGPLFAVDKYTEIKIGNILGPCGFQSVSLALYYLRKMKLTNVTFEFESSWNESVQKKIFESPEFKEINLHEIDDYDYKYRMIKLAKKYTYLSLDDKYKKETDPSIEEMLRPRDYYYIAPKSELIMVKSDEVNNSTELSDPAVLNDMVSQNPAVERLIKDLDLDMINDDLPF
jgi:hypothetical protein